jgi:flavin reductase (DIM6/NTAB) family NADH-FMN oxidoreductase RutF
MPFLGRKDLAMEKRDIGAHGFLYPMPMVVVGADIEEKPTFMPLAWVTRARHDPPALALAMNKNHVTNRGIHSHREFGVSVPGRELLQAVDYCGLVSARSRDKSRVFTAFSGRLTHAPMIAECPLTMECRLLQTVDMDSHDLFIGEIVGTWTDDRYLTGGKPDIEKLQPFTLTMPDNRYWAVGEQVGTAWSDGRGYMPADDLLP